MHFIRICNTIKKIVFHKKVLDIIILKIVNPEKK